MMKGGVGHSMLGSWAVATQTDVDRAMGRMALWVLLLCVAAVALGWPWVVCALAGAPLVLNGIASALDSRCRVLGWANAVTAFRLVVALLVGLFPDQLMFGDYRDGLALAVFMGLDFLDGYLARLFKEESKLGALLDEESDSLAGMVVCVVGYSTDKFTIQSLPALALVPLSCGVLHYVFIVIKEMFHLEWPPRQPYARFFAGLALTLSVLAMTTPTGSAFSLLCVYLATAVNLASFGYSYYQMFAAKLRKVS